MPPGSPRPRPGRRDNWANRSLRIARVASAATYEPEVRAAVMTAAVTAEPTHLRMQTASVLRAPRGHRALQAAALNVAYGNRSGTYATQHSSESYHITLISTVSSTYFTVLVIPPALFRFVFLTLSGSLASPPLLSRRRTFCRPICPPPTFCCRLRVRPSPSLSASWVSSYPLVSHLH